MPACAIPPVMLELLVITQDDHLQIHSPGAFTQTRHSRDIVAEVEGLDVRYLLSELAAAYPSCWTFHVDGLVGATPELLVRRTGDLVTSRVLAGTVRRRGNAKADAGLARELMKSGKDTEEHELAVQSVAEST